jgi:hypothetical protein
VGDWEEGQLNSSFAFVEKVEEEVWMHLKLIFLKGEEEMKCRWLVNDRANDRSQTKLGERREEDIECNIEIPRISTFEEQEEADK